MENKKVNSALTIVDEKGCRIAQTTSGRGLPTQTQEFNTQLIASAPDMLRALKTLVNHTKELQNIYKDTLGTSAIKDAEHIINSLIIK